MHSCMENDIEKILFTEEQIKQRVKEMGDGITQRYAGAAPDDVVVIGVLRGAAVFMSDLVRCIDLPINLDFMAVSSYGKEAVSSGKVRITKDVSFDLAGRHVIVAEDIIDSGLTLAYLTENFKTRGAKSVEIVALLYKDVPRSVEIECADIGFTCPDEFIVGYGLDYAERYRNLPYVAALKRSVYAP